MTEVTIDIDPKGNVKVGVKGIDGPDCQKLTAEIEAALGDVEQTTKTTEFHRARTLQRKVGA